MKGNIYLAVEKQGHALHWQIQRAERRNALGTELGQEIEGALAGLIQDLEPWLARRDMAAEPPYRCLVISAKTLENSGKTPIWIAGGDLKDLREMKQPSEGRAYATLYTKICLGLQSLPIPVLTVIDGLVIGGGVEFALAADLRFASLRSELHFKQLEVGLTSGFGGCQRLLSLVGQARATDLLMMRRKLSAQQACDYGLINEIVDEPKKLDTVVALHIDELSTLSPWSLMAQKVMLQQPSQYQKGETLKTELDLFEGLWMHRWHHDFLQKFALPKQT